MNRGNKLWEGHRMIIPEHRAYMLERENRQAHLERPVLDECKLEDMNQVLSEAAERGVLVTLTVYKPTGHQEVVLVPKRMEGDRLKGLNISGNTLFVPLCDVIDATLSV